VKAHIAYRLQSLTIRGRKIVFNDPVMFWPVSKSIARLIPGNGWPGKLPMLPIGPVTEIAYAISATNERVCVTEYFVHPATRECIVAGKIDKDCYLQGSPLFTSVDASWLLKTPSLKGLRVIQFVC